MIDHTHDAAASTWVAGADAHEHFPVQNLPLGIFSPVDSTPRIGTAIGDWCLDLAALASLLPETTRSALAVPLLNALFALPPQERLALRHAIFALLTDASRRGEVEPHLHRAADCALHLPFQIGDYTDFYVGIHHATNIGRLFRPDNPLLPNYKHVPIGYHGRASSVRPSGTPLVRPKGQLKGPNDAAPRFTPSQRLDFELELGAWIAGENDLGASVPIGQAWDRIGGLCLLNDWSARDIQAWEYQPLGPFLAKNFLSSVSPWVITREALAPFHVPQPPRPEGDPAPLDYLTDEADQQCGALAVRLAVTLSTRSMRDAGLPPVTLSQGSATAMYWTLAQMVTHHTSNGCNLAPGDLLGTGTISGTTRGSEGSLMELSRGGTEPVTLPGGESRTFLEDGDELVLSATAEQPGYRAIGFGLCAGVVEPAR
ncbi:fumarylacetoacetase [Novosphingobium sp. Leaf2]|uniref:fumarylacetoacetase n=1 Tax=Novosphingobium sp. Leaf2 TaxID=1735670 RepID=UPI0006F7E647|nr:fumarylacetoacetase [Novosphingobium sp. Leaf2]KQM18979.1 fumarylacetoacetase [Novosphingobium sp. Leaf2]